MNKTAIKNFAIWARNKLIADIQYRAGLMGITEDGIKDPLPQSTGTMEFYDIGTAEPYAITGEAISQRKKLVEIIRRKETDSNYATAYKYILEEVAYTWFNRLIAIRFMEVNDYLPSRIRVLSSESGKIEPDLVTTPFDAELAFTPAEEETVLRLKTENKLDELFRLLFIKQCNALNEILPALFEKTSDYTELLLNLSVVDQDGVVYHLTHDIPEQDFDITHPDEDGKIQGQVEIIGWLYQYYNTEPKNAAFAKNGKITKEEIPAVTQLFTPDWIVRYMVENSLGRIFIDKRKEQGVFADGRGPEEMSWDEVEAKRISNEEEIAGQMGWKYYLPEAAQTQEVRQQLDEIQKQSEYKDVRDIKIIDPCMGSGHILVYAFDVLMQMYENDGYSQRDAAQCILEHNLFGLDIDDRAAQLAYFAVMMKARQYDRRIFSRSIQPHVYAIVESNGVNAGALDYFANGEPQLVAALDSIVNDLCDAKEYGSILTVAPVDFAALYARADEIYDDINLYREEALATVLPLIRAAEVLAQQYDVVVTNPPYMGSSGMGGKLAEYVKKHYPDSKSDLFAVFIEACGKMTKRNGYQAMITQHAWMFLSSFEKLRAKLLLKDTVNMAHLGPRAFEEIGGEVVQTTSFVLRTSHIADYKGAYCRLIEPTTQQGKEEMFLSGENRYTAQQSNFSKIPGSPVAYWVSNALLNCFLNREPLDVKYKMREGIHTADNERFLRLWHEVTLKSIVHNAASYQDIDSRGRWVPYNKGGAYRKWYGNNDWVIGFDSLYRNAMAKLKGHVRPSESIYFLEGGTWTAVTMGGFGIRYYPAGYLFDAGGQVAVGPDIISCIAYLNSKLFGEIAKLTMPTINYKCGIIKTLPNLCINKGIVKEKAIDNVTMSQKDWDSYETSWDFKRHPLVISVEKDEGETVLLGMKISQKKWIEKLRNGSACFNTVNFYIEKGLSGGNDEQGDKYEGVFARLLKHDSKVEEMEKLLKDDLEVILDGEYVLLRRKSARTIPVFCIYGLYIEDAKILSIKETSKGKSELKLEIIPQPKMFKDFLDKPISDESEAPWHMSFSVGHMQDAIESSLDEKSIKHTVAKVKYDLFSSDTFFVYPGPEYPELFHKAKRFSYQKELRWILPELHRDDKLILDYPPLGEHSAGIGDSEYRAVFHVEGHDDRLHNTVKFRYEKWKNECEQRFLQLKANEEELNRIFIDIYGLQDELTPEVADKDVTVHRIFDTKDDVSESMQGSNYVRTKRDEIVSLLSYAVGCMFGRYSLDRQGLIFAGGNFDSVYWKFKGQAALNEQGDPIDGGYAGISLANYHYPKFHDAENWEDATSLSYEPDVDGILPITDEEYLEDDIVSRLCGWLKAAYGEDTLEENLDFIAGALGGKGNSSREIIRSYFLRDFFKDHCKTYQKRPIYWLFDSGKQNGFKALIYLHRYTPDTIGNLRVDYLHKMQRVYESEIGRMQDMIDHSQNAREVAASTKRKEKLQKQLKECRDYDEMIAHLALSRIELDLDDGVKVNYEKIQTASDGKKYAVLVKI